MDPVDVIGTSKIFHKWDFEKKALSGEWELTITVWIEWTCCSRIESLTCLGLIIDDFSICVTRVVRKLWVRGWGFSPYCLKSYEGSEVGNSCRNVRLVDWFLWQCSIIWWSISSCDGYQIYGVVDWLNRTIQCNDGPNGLKYW